MDEILRKLVAFPTVSGDHQAMHELLVYVAGFVEQRGMHVEWLESNGFESIVATVRPGHKTPKVMLAAHADVVPAPPELFELREENGAYYGRGVVDMKFAIAAYLQIIDDIKDELQHYDIGLMITGDEEVGGRNGTFVAVNAGYIPQVCIIPDGGDNWHVQTGSKGLLVYQVDIDGVSAHGSRPWLGDNAITKLMTLLDEVKSFFPPQPGPDTNTISVTRINSGKVVNQVPDSATAFLDVRTLDAHEYKRLNHAIFEACRRHSAECAVVSDGAPTNFSLDDPLIAPFARRVEAVTGVEQTGFFANGGSDARFFVPFGVPCISVYPAGGDHHSDGEWLDKAAFGQFRGILADYLRQVARTDTHNTLAENLEPAVTAKID